MIISTRAIYIYIIYIHIYVYINDIFLFADEAFLSNYPDDTALYSIQKSHISNQSILKKYVASKIVL